VSLTHSLARTRAFTLAPYHLHHHQAIVTKRSSPSDHLAIVVVVVVGCLRRVRILRATPHHTTRAPPSIHLPLPPSSLPSTIDHPQPAHHLASICQPINNRSRVESPRREIVCRVSHTHRTPTEIHRSNDLPPTHPHSVHRECACERSIPAPLAPWATPTRRPPRSTCRSPSSNARATPTRSGSASARSSCSMTRSPTRCTIVCGRTRSSLPPPYRAALRTRRPPSLAARRAPRAPPARRREAPRRHLRRTHNNNNSSSSNSSSKQLRIRAIPTRRTSVAIGVSRQHRAAAARAACRPRVAAARATSTPPIADRTHRLLSGAAVPTPRRATPIARAIAVPIPPRVPAPDVDTIAASCSDMGAARAV